MPEGKEMDVTGVADFQEVLSLLFRKFGSVVVVVLDVVVDVIVVVIVVGVVKGVLEVVVVV